VAFSLHKVRITMRTTSYLAVALTSLLASACTDEQTDELAGDSSAEGDVGKGDAAEVFNFFNLIGDTRACSLNSPSDCGVGFFVSQANRATLRCGRGPAKSQCKTLQIEWRTGMPASVSKAYEDGLREGQPLLVRGEIQPDPADRGMTMIVTEVWTASKPDWVDGVFTLVKDSGIRCITAPCPSLIERKLNSNLFAQISGVDFET
jgi:hypothetical protein